MKSLLPLLLAGCAGLPREELVGGLTLAHVPVEGTSLPPYALAKFETTWNDFAPFYREDRPGSRLLDGLSRPSVILDVFRFLAPPDFFEGVRPVVGARWHTAMAYCDWLTATTGRKFRLPTHAEWELAARAGTSGVPSDRGWRLSTSRGGPRRPGSAEPNAWGIHDMFGNVWELALEGEYRGGAWNSLDEEIDIDRIQPAKPEWWESDPNRPRSLWWLTDGFCQGFRVACVGDAAATRASADYLPKVSTRVVKAVATQGRGDRFRTVTVEVRNDGPAAIEELEIQVRYLDAQGGPHWIEKEGTGKPGRPTYAWAYPVLASGRAAEFRKRLAPGETRRVSADVPETDDPPNLVRDAFGARATWVRLAP